MTISDQTAQDQSAHQLIEYRESAERAFAFFPPNQTFKDIIDLHKQYNDLGLGVLKGGKNDDFFYFTSVGCIFQMTQHVREQILNSYKYIKMTGRELPTNTLEQLSNELKLITNVADLDGRIRLLDSKIVASNDEKEIKAIKQEFSVVCLKFYASVVEIAGLYQSIYIDIRRILRKSENDTSIAK